MALLQPVDIREVWGEVRYGLEHVRQKTEAPWRPEDIYAACVMGKAHVYLGEPGFVVFQPQENKLTGAPELLVWVAYSREVGAVKEFQDAVDEVARSGGFAKLVMWSNRAGWERNDGWKAVATVYEREL